MHQLNLLLAALLSTAALSSAAAIPQSLISAPNLPIQTTHNDNTTQLPYGVVIDHCTVPSTIAIAFDDGPYIYTEQVLDILANASIHATFFFNGDWKGNIYELSHIVKRTLAEGHQIGSHSWNHLNLTTLPYNDILTQMFTLESAFHHILGFTPTYTRTPWLHVNELVLSALRDLRYHVIGASIVTDDKTNDHPSRSWRSFELFREGLEGGGSIVLAHDSQENTAMRLVEDMIGEVGRRGLKAVPVGECLGHPEEFWYRSV
ncbi:peptidoglycan-N-acetylglucosamine deacetylase [Penicillium cataractarum]|uniref:Peptidoglycan-N-acetylglucosamine deacetylase n=1 Tax=Penicillium cataractarum TaxID=2100454 RepID=A0A9W9V2V7_9EURO|nr:peptidoglycan-N-acetylglucosamine deacetylase [Penicillium cataractarum]KAJ5364480.1 peptidoglycan-N-acetylglucosamine deacetylase [Penicillium cataractarum]